ncbi:hypothetical protein [Hyphobacterium sp. CCMP332]|uniref:hypothetical protein n=1 Tax=Hyphobacterium sp. CCMP332 TaxID=2749086 RepID=UPI001F22EF7C|nr:hypothetical protein [Hyphobacterium sp. CCMP332]
MTNNQCRGYAASAPDIRINFTGGAFNRINFSALSNADTTLIVNDPNGTWWCDDDSGNGLNPLIELTPISGQYDIWVGTYGRNTAPATLAVSNFLRQRASHDHAASPFVRPGLFPAAGLWDLHAAVRLHTGSV